MMPRSRNTLLHRHHPWRLFGASLLAVAVLGYAGHAVAAPAKATSSCVACHTDAEKLKVEAAKVPVPTGSALQAGKG